MTNTTKKSKPTCNCCGNEFSQENPSNEFGVSLQVQVFTSLLIFGVLLSVITIVLSYWLGRDQEIAVAPAPVVADQDDKQARIDTLMRAIDGALIATDSHGRG